MVLLMGVKRSALRATLWVFRHMPWLGLFKTGLMVLWRTVLFPITLIKGVFWARRQGKAVKQQSQVWFSNVWSELRHPKHLLRSFDAFAEWMKIHMQTFAAGNAGVIARLKTAGWRWPLMGAFVGGLVFAFSDTAWQGAQQGVATMAGVVAQNTQDTSLQSGTLSQPYIPVQTLAVLDDLAPSPLDAEPTLPAQKQWVGPMVPRSLDSAMLALGATALATQTNPETPSVSTEALPILSSQPGVASVQGVSTVPPVVNTVTTATGTHVIVRQQAVDGKPAKVTDIEVNPAQAVVIVINN
jgi:hypothetical protein